jgi:CspA family cold shock protein
MWREMSTGTVKWFNAESGYGVITDDAENRDLFVHRGNLAGATLSGGDRVEFETGRGGMHAQAIGVRATTPRP